MEEARLGSSQCVRAGDGAGRSSRSEPATGPARAGRRGSGRPGGGRFETLVEHEIEVLAERSGRVLLCESELRTEPRATIALPVALAAFGRAVGLDAVGEGEAQTQLVTNARFAADARTSARGLGIHLLGWGGPEDGGLERQLEEASLFPVPALP